METWKREIINAITNQEPWGYSKDREKLWNTIEKIVEEQIKKERTCAVFDEKNLF